MTDRRPLGLPVFSEPIAAIEVPAHDGFLLPVGRAVFQSPPVQEDEQPLSDRHSLTSGGLSFSDPYRDPYCVE